MRSSVFSKIAQVQPRGFAVLSRKPPGTNSPFCYLPSIGEKFSILPGDFMESCEHSKQKPSCGNCRSWSSQPTGTERRALPRSSRSIASVMPIRSQQNSQSSAEPGWRLPILSSLRLGRRLQSIRCGGTKSNQLPPGSSLKTQGTLAVNSIAATCRPKQAGGRGTEGWNQYWKSPWLTNFSPFSINSPTK